MVGWFILILSTKIWNKSDDEMRGCFVISAYSFIGAIIGLIYLLQNFFGR
jgi:hypothetical protein